MLTKPFFQSTVCQRELHISICTGGFLMQQMQSQMRKYMQLQVFSALDCTICKTSVWLRTRRSGVQIFSGVPKPLDYV